MDGCLFPDTISVCEYAVKQVNEKVVDDTTKMKVR